MEKPKKPTLDYDTLLERLELKALKVGDVVRIVTGPEGDAWTYTFRVTEMGNQWPTGMLSAIVPDGTVTEEVEFTLHGTGNWTTPSQNPVQDRMLQRGFSSYWESVRVGDLVVGRFAGQPDRSVLGDTGQEVASVSVSAAPPEA